MALKVAIASLSPSGWWASDGLTGNDGDTLSAWADLSGNGRDLAQATAGYRPTLRLQQLNRYPAVRFDGSDDYMATSVNLSALLGTDGLGTIVALVRFRLGATLSGDFDVCGVAGANGYRLRVGVVTGGYEVRAGNYDGTLDEGIRALEIDCGDAGAGLYVVGPGAPAPQLLAWRHDTAAGEVGAAANNFDDEAFAVTGATVTTGASTDLANVFRVGGGSAGVYWFGDIFELITFPTALTEAELRGVALTLTDKWGLPYDSGIEAVREASAALRVEMSLPSTELQVSRWWPGAGTPQIDGDAIGAPFRPTLWLKADALTGLSDDDPVATWPDSSDEGNDFAQGTAGYRPKYKTNILNGHPAVLFDGTDDKLDGTVTLAEVLSGGGAGTVYAVCKATSTVGEQAQGIIRDLGNVMHLRFNESGTAALQGKNDDGSVQVLTKAYTFGEWALALWCHHPDAYVGDGPQPSYLYVGLDDIGEWAQLDSTASGWTSDLTNTLVVGKDWQTDAFLNGYLAELLVFPRAHTKTERRHVYSYLAAKYALTYDEAEYQPVWLDVTEDVRSAPGLSFVSGITGIETIDRVASSGELTLTLENSAAKSSGGVEGYYSPEHTNRRAGFRVGTPVRVGFTYYGATYYKFRGWITRIRVLPGQLLERAVEVTARDWIDAAARSTVSGLDVTLNERADDLFYVLYAHLYTPHREPVAVMLNQGSDVYPYAFDSTEDEGVLILSEIYRLTISEVGYTYIKGNISGGGVLRFETRGTRAGTPVRWAMADADITALELAEHDLDGIINRVAVELHPRRVDAAATSVLFSLQTIPQLGAAGSGSESLTFVAPYRDPSGRFVRVGGVNMVTPVSGTDYAMNAQSDGGGADLTADLDVTVVYSGNSATVTLENTGLTAGYVTLLQLRGKGIYAFESVVIEKTDAASVAAYGQMMRRIDMPYQADVVLAESVAAQILAANAEPRTKVRRVEFVAQWDSAAMMHALARDIGDRVTITEQVSGLTAAEYFINAIRFRVVQGPAFFVSWLLVPTDQEDYTA